MARGRALSPSDPSASGRGCRPAARWVAWVVAGVVCLLYFAGTLRPGYLLVRDFVTVPDPVLGAAALGRDGAAPRAVPLDAITAVLDPVVPAALQQRLLLVGSVLLLGAGVGMLVRSRGWPAVVTATVVATWNPYVVERLLLGQAPTLLGVAALPWLVIACRPGPYRSQLARALLAALPAALTPFGSVLAVATLALVTTATSGARRAAAVALPSLILCVPWVVPALAGAPTRSAAQGADAFAARQDSGLGLVGSVLTWGGIWAPGAHLSSRAEVVPMLAALALVLVVAASAILAVRGGGRRAAALVLAWSVPPVLVLALATPVGLSVMEVLQQVPGLALFRDTHRLLGVSVVGGAVLAGLLVARTTRSLSPPAVTAAVALIVSVVVTTVPDGPRRLHAAYTPVAFPSEWADAVSSVPAESRHVLVLPWQAIRPPLPGGRVPFLDPVPRALEPPTVTSRDLVVRRADGPVLVPEGEPEIRLDDPTQARRALDSRQIDVVWWWGVPESEPPPGFVTVHDGSQITVWRRGGDPRSQLPRGILRPSTH